MKRLLLLPLLILLQHCAPSSDAGTNDLSPFNDENLPSDLSLTTLPIVKSPTLEKRWGKPKARVLPDGSYHLSYVDPRSSFETLDIYVKPGSINTDTPKPPPYGMVGWDEKKQAPIPKRVPQEWNTVTILGKPVHTCCDYAGDGADPASFSSITFPVEKPGSPTFSVRLTATSNTETPAQTAETYMKTLR